MTIDENRLAEIRVEFDRAQRRGGQLVGATRDLLAMLDATREDLRAIIAAAYPAQPDATPTVREVREHIGALHDAVASAEKRAEDAERKLAALHAAAQHVRWGIDENESGGGWRDLVAALDASLTDTAPVAERHDREVELRLLQRMSERLAADRIERGEA